MIIANNNYFVKEKTIFNFGICVRGCADARAPLVLEGSVFYSCSKLAYNEYNNAKYLGNSDNPYMVLMNAKNTSVTSCDIHPDTKSIAGQAFYNGTALTNNMRQ